MSDKKTSFALKAATATALPIIAISVAGWLIRKNFNNLMQCFDLPDSQKGFAKNVTEEYPTKRAVIKASKLHVAKNHDNQHSY